MKKNSRLPDFAVVAIIWLVIVALVVVLISKHHCSNEIQNMLPVILLVSALICFWLFFKSIDWFEKI